MADKLTFGKGNRKIDKDFLTFSLPAGFTCAGAKDCLSRAVKTKNGVRIKDAPGIKFRCFAASQEVLYPSVYNSRRKNFSLLRKAEKIGSVSAVKDLIIASLPKNNWRGVRINCSGDFYGEAYFLAWLEIAKLFSTKTFYFYTKNIPLWLKYIKLIGNGKKPGKIKNIVPTASLGGKWDGEALTNGLRYAKVVDTEREAIEQRLCVDTDDSHAQSHGDSFALLVHGQNPPHVNKRISLKLIS